MTNPVTTPRNTYGSKKPVPWKALGIGLIILIVIAFAIVGLTSVLGSSTDNPSGQPNKPSNQAAPQSKSMDWFQAQWADIQQLQRDLTAAQEREMQTEKWYRMNNSTRIPWEESTWRQPHEREISGIKAQLSRSATEYNAEAVKIDSRLLTEYNLPTKIE